MRSIAVSVPLLVLILLAQLTPTLALEGGHEIRFYIYGAPTCPHCNHLKETLIQVYGEGAVVFKDVTIRENGEELLTLYMILYPEVKQPGVPLTIIVVDGSPAASAVGDAEPEFWQFLIEKHLEVGKFLRVDFEGNVQVTDRDQQLRTDIARVIGLTPPTTSTVIEPSDEGGGSPTARKTTYTVITLPRDRGSGENWVSLLAGISSIAILCAIIVAYLKLRSRSRVRVASRRSRR